MDTIIAPTYPDFIVYFDFGDNKNGVGIYEIKDAHKVEDVNDRKHVAIKDYINKIQTRSGSTIQAYGGIVKVIDYKAFDEEGNPIGEIENINVYPELKNE